MGKSKEEVTMVALEIIANAGDARTKFMSALEEANNGNFDKAQKLIDEANECILEAHKAQTNLLQEEARGENMEIGFFMIHAQDHLMTTMLLRDVMKNFINLYKRTLNN